MLLKRTLFVNGVATAATGLLALAGAPWIAPILGVPSPALVAIVGAGLVVFAAALLVQSRHAHVDPRVAWTITALDVAWVLGSVAVIEAGVLTPLGNLALAAVAAVVLLFAVLEIVGIRSAQALTA